MKPMRSGRRFPARTAALLFSFAGSAGFALAYQDALAALEAGADRTDRIEIRGRVLDPDGRPVAGAEVYLTRPYFRGRSVQAALARTRSDAEGRFVTSYSRSDPRFAGDVFYAEMWRRVKVVAFAPGLGPGWVERVDVPPEQEAVLSLVKDVPLKEY